MQRILRGAAVSVLALLAAGCGDDSGNPRLAGTNLPGNDVPNAEDFLDGDGELDLGEVIEGSTDFLEGLTGSGGGTVEIYGDTIEFTSDICFAGQGDFTIEGLGATGDGTPVWVSISQNIDSRAEVIGFLGEDTVQLIYGDADPIIENDLAVEYGRSEIFGPGADDLPDFTATTGGGQEQIDIAVNGSSANGSGAAVDFNFVAGEFDDTFPFTFQVGCN